MEEIAQFVSVSSILLTPPLLGELNGLLLLVITPFYFNWSLFCSFLSLGGLALPSIPLLIECFVAGVVRFVVNIQLFLTQNHCWCVALFVAVVIHFNPHCFTAFLTYPLWLSFDSHLLTLGLL